MPLDFIKKLLAEPENPDIGPDDARAAIASVLVMAARVDDHYDDREKAIIDTVLAERFALSAAEAAALRTEGEAAEGESIDIYQFTRAIKNAVPHDDRLAIVEALWRVILADAERDPHEDMLMRQIVDRLGLSPMESALARQKVQGGGAAPAM